MRSIIYLDGRDLERTYEAFMKFRLMYEGDLLSSKWDEANFRSWHKHDIRRRFHPQLKELWDTHRFLGTNTMDAASVSVLPSGAADVFEQRSGRSLMTDILGDVYAHHGYRYVPLIWKEAFVACSLRILILRRDSPHTAIQSRDIDNRVKTLIDALCMVEPKQGAPRDKEGKIVSPSAGEDPFFVLMDNDQRVTHLEVEHDEMLTPDPQNPDNTAYAKVLITVETRATPGTNFNSLFD